MSLSSGEFKKKSLEKYVQICINMYVSFRMVLCPRIKSANCSFYLLANYDRLTDQPNHRSIKRPMET